MTRHFGKGESQLHFGEARADADMRARAKGEVLTDRARDVEGVGIGKGRRIAVAAGIEDDDLVALADRLAAEFGIARRGAAHMDHRARVAHHFLDRVGKQAGVGADGVPLIGVVREGDQAVVDRVARRLVAADEREDRGCR